MAVTSLFKFRTVVTSYNGIPFASVIVVTDWSSGFVRVFVCMAAVVFPSVVKSVETIDFWFTQDASVAAATTPLVLQNVWHTGSGKYTALHSKP